MDYQTIEVLNPRGDDAFGHQAFKQDRVTTGANRTPTPRTRRATGESEYRDKKPGHSRPAGGTSMSKITSAPSTPRPIPKQNKNGVNGKSLQPPSSYSYSFDDNIIDPFMPSTPPTFIASMEPTFFKSDVTTNKNQSKEDPGPSSRLDETPVTKSQKRSPRPRSSTIATPSVTPTPITSNTKAPDSPKSPVPTSSKSGISQMRGTRTRDASVSSIPKPSHDDMILPAVARRIKEEGLFNHDVIAYSDDYNAPLYRLPTTPGTTGNPFASYDREKSNSSINLSSPTGHSSPNDRQFDRPADEIPTSNRHEEDPIKRVHQKQSSSVNNPVPRDPSATPLERRETPSSSPIPEAIPQLSTPPRERRSGKDSDAVITAVPEPSIPAGRPDRPRRSRRNTEGRQHVDLPEQEQYVRQQSPSSDRKGQVSENDIQALDVRGTMQGNDKANRQQRRRSKTMDQERYNVSNDFYADIQKAEAAQFVAPKKPATTRQQHENSNGFQKRQNQYPNNEGGDRYDQYDQQYSKNNHQGRQYRNEEPAQPSPRNRYDRQPQEAQDPYNYDRQQSQQQYQQYQQESKYAQEPQYTQETQYAQGPQSAQRQQRRQKHYPQPEDQTQRQSHALGGRSHYNQQHNYGVDQVQDYDNQDYEHRQPSRQHDDQSRYAQGATHIEMSQLYPEPQHDTLSNNNPEVIDSQKMKKKGAVCCIIC
ncbi:hypothetical protein BGZ81_000004 [Podila clonocystis]|nr:hypothetical protein BGZ81_000004 [Podila clonocystis]